MTQLPISTDADPARELVLLRKTKRELVTRYVRGELPDDQFSLQIGALDQRHAELKSLISAGSGEARVVPDRFE